MLETLNSWILVITRPVLDWMLYLPRDVVLFIVAISTALILTGVRVFTTDQKQLKRCKEDKARLKQIIREAKKRGDKDAVQRCRLTVGQIGMVTMKAEGKPLLVSLVPIALLAVWAFANIAYVAPQDGQTVTVKMTFPKTEIGKVVTLLPADGVEPVPPSADEPGIKPESGWVQPIVKDYAPVPTERQWKLLTDPEALKEHQKKEAEAEELAKKENRKPPAREELPTVSNGLATWNLKCRKSDTPYRLTFRFDGKEYTKDLIVDGVHYADPVTFYDFEGSSVYAAELVLPEYKLFGFVPGIPILMLQAWIIGYLVIVIPFSLILKPVLRIY